MRALFGHISGISGLLVFVKELWNDAPIEHILYAGAVTAFGVYCALMLADLGVRHILEHTKPSETATAGAPEGDTESQSAAIPTTEAAKA